jgi:adenylate cyclase
MPTRRVSADDAANRRLTRDELARSVRVDPDVIDELLDWQLIKPDARGLFRPSDIQRVRAVMAMRSPGIPLDQLIEAFRGRLFTLQPMDYLYPDPPVVTDLTPDEVARSLGMTEQELMRLMITAGFPAPVSGVGMREDDVALAQAMVDAARRLGGAETLGRFARTFGDTSRRAAEAAVAMFAENVQSPVVNARDDDGQRMRINKMAGQLMRSSEQLLGELYRRHMEHVLLRQWATQSEAFLEQIGVRPSTPQDHGLAFVDLAGYTELTERTGDTTALRLAARLADLAEDAVARTGGRVVKLLGDGAMLHFDEVVAAVRGALTLVKLVATSDLPPAHAGVHAGPVIERDGDYFGRTVNIAARVSSLASAGQVLVTDDVARQPAPDVTFALAGTRPAKGIGEITVHEARWRD